MRIAYFINTYPKVSHSFIRREIHALEARGHMILRFSADRSPEPLPDPDDQRELARTFVMLDQGLAGLGGSLVRVALHRPAGFVRVLREAWRSAWRGRSGWLKTCGYIVEACVLYEEVTRERVEHVHAHFGTSPALVAMLCHTLGGPPFSFTVHGPEEFDHPIALDLANKVAHATFVFGVSRFGCGQLMRWVDPKHGSKIRRIPCGLDAAFLTSDPTDVPEVLRFVFVGRLCAQKGPLVLLQAAARLAARGESFTIQMVGDGPMRRRVESTIEALRLQDHVELLGWADGAKIRRLIDGARALVLPSLAEGLPVVLMEALARCRPVITTWVAGIPELVGHDVHGWLVPPGDEEALANAMHDALHQAPEQLTAMGRRGRAHLEVEHDIHRTAQLLEDCWAKKTWNS